MSSVDRGSGDTAGPARTGFWKRPRLLLLIVPVAGLAIAFGITRTGSEVPGVPATRGQSGTVPTVLAATTARVKDRSGPQLWIVRNNIETPFSNGDRVRAGNLDVEIAISPYPPNRTPNVDFYVTKDGEPVQDADVSLQYDMTSMDHGPFALLAIPASTGHFIAPTTFTMDGVFWLNISIFAGKGESVINLLVQAER